MRTKSVILLSSIAICLVLGLMSCAKREAAPTAFSRLLGKWKLAKTATDDNGNGIIEASEIHTLPEGQDYEKVFNNDGSGVETAVYNKITSPPLTFKWQIINGDSLRVLYTANDTLTFYLSNASSVDLTLTLNGKQSLEWYYYTKM